ncbi:MAG TPA: glycerol-3-phosphate dehydrogenase/oxidase [Fontimonas sp.]
MPPRTDLATLDARYDLIVIGGGITGAGIAREAIRSGARVLLVDARDFAAGTSSWSSKLVHGGLRYLKNGQWRLTLESVRERQRLLREAPGLVDAQPFIMPIYANRKPGRWLMQLGLLVYDWMAGVRRSRWLARDAVLGLEPDLCAEFLSGAMLFEDASTDDARLVLRLLAEAERGGATLRNYCEASVRHSDGRCVGVSLRDAAGGAQREIDAGVVINATGAWAAQLPGAPATGPRLRPLRGSHLLIAQSRLPLRHAISWLHPQDQRPVFAHPWEGAVVLGTTDIDHAGPLDKPRISDPEVSYLLDALHAQFPRLNLTVQDVLASYAGIRPVVDSGKLNPSAESRESALWSSPGLVNVTGGKLTTFRTTAREALRAAAGDVPQLQPAADAAVFGVDATASAPQRLAGRYGAPQALQMLAGASADEREAVMGTPYSWAELRWSVRHEWVQHLQDLMMRRTRLGLVAAQGGAEALPRILGICRQELGWDEVRCARERNAYLEYWRAQHAPPSF